jgi:hypothetical protein
MNHTPAGEAAFPRLCGAANSEEQSLEHKGMTIREWFAGMAMQGLLRAVHAQQYVPGIRDLAVTAFSIADAMIAENQAPRK